jgi:CBS domain-containing protein
MREQRVEEVVVTAGRESAAKPAGVVSARDIVARVVALGLDAAIVTVGDLLWSPSAAAELDDSVGETLTRLCATGNETMPVVNAEGRIMGVISLDDLLQALAGSEPSRADRFHR